MEAACPGRRPRRKGRREKENAMQKGAGHPLIRLIHLISIHRGPATTGTAAPVGGRIPWEDTVVGRWVPASGGPSARIRPSPFPPRTPFPSSRSGTPSRCAEGPLPGRVEDPDGCTRAARTAFALPERQAEAAVDGVKSKVGMTNGIAVEFGEDSIGGRRRPGREPALGLALTNAWDASIATILPAGLGRGN